jgi:tetratricopeptide (TPR) repeat protein
MESPRKRRRDLTAAFLVLLFALNLWGCGPDSDKPRETPLEKAGRLLAQEDAASLLEARAALQGALKADPESARIHYLLGKTYITEAQGEQARDKLGQLHSSAITELEQARELYGDEGVPIEVYQDLVGVYRQKAILPTRFKAQKGAKAAVGPWEIKAMEKAVKIFEEGRTRFPDAPAFGGERGEALKQELTELRMLYVDNVERTWLGRPSGFAQPKEYPP